MFLGLPDPHPDPLFASTDPDPDQHPNPSLFSRVERTEMVAKLNFNTNISLLKI
jgi:hypothetical protein